MARKRTRSLAGKKFFSLVVLSVAALGLLFIANYAVQQQTSTKSEAAKKSCKTPPKIAWIGHEDGETSVKYKLRLTNNCKGWSNYVMTVSQTPTRPTLIRDWGWRFDQESWLKPLTIKKLRESQNITLEITRPGVWRGPGAREVYIEPGTYFPITVKAYVTSNTAIYNQINLSYIVEEL